MTNSTPKRKGDCLGLPAGWYGALLLLLLTTLPLASQSTGGILGRVLDARTGTPLAGVTIRLGQGKYFTESNSRGDYQLKAVDPGNWAMEAIRIGYRAEKRDDIQIISGQMIRVDILLAPQAVALTELQVIGIRDPVLDPLATTTEQRVTAEDFRRLPISSIEDAVALQAGVVGESWRGGRTGQQALILDGLGIKNQFDASTGTIGLRIPPDMLEEFAVVTNAFSARYGQAVSGLLEVTTRDGGPFWRGRLAYETDRPMQGGSDLGLDRLVLQADGPLLGRITGLGVIDLSARMDADPSSAPGPTDPRDPRTRAVSPLPHNSGEIWSAGGKLTIPATDRLTARVFGLLSRDQRLLFDPRYKYDPEFGPGQRVDASIYTTSLQLLPDRKGSRSVFGELRIGAYSREFARGATDIPDYGFGAFSGRKLEIMGEQLARTQDTLRAFDALPGFEQSPQYSDRTPWGVPAWFIGGAPVGEVSWNRFREFRAQLDGNWDLGGEAELRFGGTLVSQQARSFQRALAHFPVGGRVPPPVRAELSPVSLGAYIELAGRFADLGVNLGLRLDSFDPRGVSDNRSIKSRTAVNPRLAVSTAIEGASVVASIGRFSQPPDLQYLIDAAFDDTLRTGRFRQGNPDLGFESATQFELSARIRLHPQVSLRSGVYYKKLHGLVSSVPLRVNPDSSMFVNADNGDVQGLEIALDLERHHGVRGRFSAVMQRATATVTNAFQLDALVFINPVTHDTIEAPRAQFPLDYDRRITLNAMLDAELGSNTGPSIAGIHPLGGLTISVVGRYLTGLPWSRTERDGRTIIGNINSERLPAQSNLDLLLRRPIRVAGKDGGVYLDIRNLLGTTNLISVRRSSGSAELDEDEIQRLTDSAYAAHPEAIPYQSSRYRAWADPGNTGQISGSALRALYERATRDFVTPIFFYGPPRQVRFGLEVRF